MVDDGTSRPLLQPAARPSDLCCDGSRYVRTMSKTARRALGPTPNRVRMQPTPPRATGVANAIASLETSFVAEFRRSRKKRPRLSDPTPDDQMTLTQLSESGRTNSGSSDRVSAGPRLSQPYVEDKCNNHDQLPQPAQAPQSTRTDGERLNLEQPHRDQIENAECYKVSPRSRFARYKRVKKFQRRSVIRASWTSTPTWRTNVWHDLKTRQNSSRTARPVI